MAAELLLVNPRRKRRKSGSRRRARVVSVARNPRRKRRLSAAQRRFFGGRKKRRSSGVIAVSRNPRRRRRSRSIMRVRRNPLPGNPMSDPIRYSENLLMPAVAGAGAGIVIDYMFARIDFLGNLGPLAGPLAKFAAAAGLGMVVSNFAGKETGNAVAIGAATITAYDIVAEWMATQNLTGGVNGMGRYSMGGKGNNRRMGYINPAKVGGMGRYSMGGPVISPNLSRLQA